jgi:hypothetical protein
MQYSRTFVRQVQTSWIQAHAHTFLSRAFQRHREHNLKHHLKHPGFGGPHNYKSKQNKTKQTTFLHR